MFDNCDILAFLTNTWLFSNMMKFDGIFFIEKIDLGKKTLIKLLDLIFVEYLSFNDSLMYIENSKLA